MVLLPVKTRHSGVLRLLQAPFGLQAFPTPRFSRFSSISETSILSDLTGQSDYSMLFGALFAFFILFEVELEQDCVKKIISGPFELFLQSRISRILILA